MAAASHQSPSLIAYVPVIHRGYVQFFEHFRWCPQLYILDSDILHELDYYRKELRAMEPAQAVKAVTALGIIPKVMLLDKAGLASLNQRHSQVVLADEDIAHLVAEQYLSKAQVTFYPVFLRWDRRNVTTAAQHPDNTAISTNRQDVAMMEQAFKEAERSPDIWRRVGAVLALRRKQLWRSSNQPLTTQNTPWADGDPRTLFNRGGSLEVSSFMHAEASLVARAAAAGISLKGATLYVTTFPCPACAMLIARSGISRCCYSEGYAMLDGRRVLEEAGTTLARVVVERQDDDRIGVPYIVPPA